MYRKIEIAVDCANDQERDAVQRIAKEGSGMLRLRASDLINAYPMIERNSALIAAAFRTISQEGMRGAIRIIPYIVNNFKK